MITVSTTEFSKNFSRYDDLVQRAPIAVTSRGRVMGYFICSTEYGEYLRLKSMLPKAYAIKDLSEETMKAIAASKMDARHNPLNLLLDD